MLFERNVDKQRTRESEKPLVKRPPLWGIHSISIRHPVVDRQINQYRFNQTKPRRRQTWNNKSESGPFAQWLPRLYGASRLCRTMDAQYRRSTTLLRSSSLFVPEISAGSLLPSSLDRTPSITWRNFDERRQRRRRTPWTYACSKHISDIGSSTVTLYVFAQIPGGFNTWKALNGRIFDGPGFQFKRIRRYYLQDNKESDLFNVKYK